MPTNITTPIGYGTSDVATKAAIQAIKLAYLNDSSTPTTYGDARTSLNLINSAFGLPVIGASDSDATIITKINKLIDAEQALANIFTEWWSTTRADLITLATANVVTWTGIKGNSVTQATGANQPIYSATSYNSGPGITFNGTTQFLQGSGSAFPSGNAGSEFWANVDTTTTAADTTSRRIAILGSGTTGQNRGLGILGNTTIVQSQALSGDGAASAARPSTVTAFGRHTHRAVQDTTTLGISLDGAAVTTQALTQNTANTNIAIGSQFGTNLYFQGVMRDILITPLLTATQATYLNNYLSTRR